MPQRDLLLPWRDALGNAGLALECQGVARAEARRRAEPLFERFGLTDFERARPAALSGGMRQRVAFLRTLLQAGLCCCSTSHSAPSIPSREPRCGRGWRTALADDPRTTLLVTHDVEDAIFLADSVASCRRGRGGSWRTSVTLPPPRRARAVTSGVRRGKARALEALGHEAHPPLGLLAARSRAWRWIARWTRGRSHSGVARRDLEALRDDARLLIDNAWVTLVEVLLGAGYRGRGGIAFAVSMHLVRPLRDAAYPLLVGLAGDSDLVLAPMFVLAFGYGIGPKLAIVALISFFPIPSSCSTACARSRRTCSS